MLFRSALTPRALEDMFWAGRYAERAEDLLRLLLTVDAEFDIRSMTDADHGVTTRVLMSALHRLAGTRYTDLEQELRSLLL